MAEDNVAQLNTELEQVRSELDQRSAEKENAYQKRQTLRSEISRRIGEVKELKDERNTFTSKVKELKETKSAKIAEQKDVLASLKEYQKQIREAQPAGGRKIHPDRLLQQVERLEYVIETEALSPKREQEVMDKIRQLKAEYEQVKGTDDVYAKYREVRKTFTNLNREISEIKKLIQNNADISQEHHLKMLEVSKHIDELKEQLDELDKEYQERRKEYLDVLDRFRAIKEKLGITVPEKRKQDRSRRREAAEAKHEAENTKLASKQEDVFAKIKNKQKLTTEDLLILQNAEMRGIKQKQPESEQPSEPEPTSEAGTADAAVEEKPAKKAAAKPTEAPSEPTGEAPAAQTSDDEESIEETEPADEAVTIADAEAAEEEVLEAEEASEESEKTKA